MHKGFQMLCKVLSAQSIDGTSLNFVLQQRSHAGFHSLHQAVILKLFKFTRTGGMKMVSCVFYSSMSWSVLLSRHMCKENCSFCDMKVASLSCPPGLVSLLRSSDNSVKSLFKDSLVLYVSTQVLLPLDWSPVVQRLCFSSLQT